MKIRLAAILVLLMTLAVLLMRNDERILNTLYALLNPLKQQYIALTEKLEAEGQSYLFQKETIDKLRRENLKLRKQLLEQVRYIEQIKEIYDVLPQMRRYSPDSVTPVHTISYVKLNSFSQILLTRPKHLENDRIYGLLENGTVAGIAMVKLGQLYGYLVSDEKCRFAVYIGDNHAPGIAEGAGENRMKVKFIPKWYDIEPGDEVVTSGLDHIFFPSLPVGYVESVQTQSAYKVATIRTMVDIYHPKVFFLIKDADKTLLRDFELSEANLTSAEPKEETPAALPPADTNATPSSAPENTHDVPTIFQTRDDVIEPEEPIENKPRPAPKKTIRKRPPEPSGLDLF